VKFFIQGIQIVGIILSSFVAIMLIKLAWSKPYPAPERIFMTLLALAAVYSFVSTWQWIKNYRRVSHLGSTQLLTGPCPTDADAVPAWKWGRQFLYAWLTLIVSLIVISYYIWKQG
jgi:hypothetical protein